MKAIGGFLPYDTLFSEKSTSLKNKIMLSSGRSSLYVILTTTKPSKVYLPYYICDEILRPLQYLNINFEFYSINKSLEINSLPELKQDEYFLYVNYFDLKPEYIKILYSNYKSNLIIDNTQAYFSNIGCPTFSFNSARKFFGIPDGSELTSPEQVILTELPENQPSTEYLKNKSEGNHDLAFIQYRAYEDQISFHPRKISRISKNILQKLDYNQISTRRKSNYQIIKNNLENLNELSLNFDMKNDVPLYYPFLVKSHTLRKKLLSKNIFTPILWDDVIARNISNYRWEKYLATNLIPLPIDQRYDSDTINDMSQLIFELTTA